mmetsp:Transcript_9910/g.17366  ORF Transcript_9910/g.17366 Transcript_9910/m.17366 type:complete len:799 (+) Transcript_9910:135-2531(+)
MSRGRKKPDVLLPGLPVPRESQSMRMGDLHDRCQGASGGHGSKELLATARQQQLSDLPDSQLGPALNGTQGFSLAGMQQRKGAGQLQLKSAKAAPHEAYVPSSSDSSSENSSEGDTDRSKRRRSTVKHVVISPNPLCRSNSFSSSSSDMDSESEAGPGPANKVGTNTSQPGTEAHGVPTLSHLLIRQTLTYPSPGGAGALRSSQPGQRTDFAAIPASRGKHPSSQAPQPQRSKPCLGGPVSATLAPPASNNTHPRGASADATQALQQRSSKAGQIGSTSTALPSLVNVSAHPNNPGGTQAIPPSRKIATRGGSTPVSPAAAVPAAKGTHQANPHMAQPLLPPGSLSRPAKPARIAAAANHGEIRPAQSRPPSHPAPNTARPHSGSGFQVAEPDPEQQNEVKIGFFSSAQLAGASRTVSADIARKLDALKVQAPARCLAKALKGTTDGTQPHALSLVAPSNQSTRTATPPASVSADTTRARKRGASEQTTSTQPAGAASTYVATERDGSRNKKARVGGQTLPGNGAGSKGAVTSGGKATEPRTTKAVVSAAQTSRERITGAAGANIGEDLHKAIPAVGDGHAGTAAVSSLPPGAKQHKKQPISTSLPAPPSVPPPSAPPPSAPPPSVPPPLAPPPSAPTPEPELPEGLEVPGQEEHLPQPVWLMLEDLPETKGVKMPRGLHKLNHQLQWMLKTMKYPVWAHVVVAEYITDNLNTDDGQVMMTLAYCLLRYHWGHSDRESVHGVLRTYFGLHKKKAQETVTIRLPALPKKHHMRRRRALTAAQGGGQQTKQVAGSSQILE